MKEKMMRQSLILPFLSATLLCFVTSVEGSVLCSFDKDPCMWEEANGKHCWIVSKSGQSLAEITNYLYFNNSCSTGSEMKTKPKTGFFTKGEDELHFWYYMHGDGEGNLSIVNRHVTDSFFGIPPEVSFDCGGDHGHQWHHAHVKIPGTVKYIGIIANTTGSFLIAISNITADHHTGVVPKVQTCPPTRRVTLEPSLTSTVTRKQNTNSRSEKNSLAGVCVFFVACLCARIL